MLYILPEILKENLPLSTMSIINEAVNRGASYEVISPRDFVVLRLNGHEEHLASQCTKYTTYGANRICKDKNTTKVFLNRAGIKTPEGQLFLKGAMTGALEYAKELGWPIVLKPKDGTKGQNVFANIHNEDEFQSKWSRFADSDEIIVEKKFVGTEYRIWATRDKVYGINNRVPANVIGDGKSTILELVDEKNKDKNRGLAEDPLPLKKIEINDEAIHILEKSDKKPDSIPQNGEQVFLRNNSNLFTGGDSIESLDIAHPSVKEIAVKAVCAIPGLPYGGVDFMTTDITAPQDDGTYVIIEMNHSPGIDGHQFPAVGTPRNIAKVIVDMLFPETIVEGDK